MTGSTELLKDTTHPSTEHPRQLPIRVLHFTAVEKTNYFLNNLVDYCDRRAVEFTVVTLTGEGGVRCGTEKAWNICVLSGLCRSDAELPALAVAWSVLFAGMVLT